jgi:uncharacterized cupredoxin-like copper-binding protein
MTVFHSKTMAVLLAALLVAAGITLAWAHGDDDHEHDTFAAGEPGDPTKPFRVVHLSMTEGSGSMAYDPAEIDVKQGEQIKLVIKNTGALDHEFFLDSFQHNAAHKIEMEKNPEMEHDEPNAQRLTPGKEIDILWRFSVPGTFEFACLIPGHYEAGMHGKVVVK